MSDITHAALVRLKRRIGIENKRCQRFWNEAHNSSTRDRAQCEGNMCRLFAVFVDAEIKKNKAKTP